MAELLIQFQIFLLLGESYLLTLNYYSNVVLKCILEYSINWNLLILDGLGVNNVIEVFTGTKPNQV